MITEFLCVMAFFTATYIVGVLSGYFFGYWRALKDYKTLAIISKNQLRLSVVSDNGSIVEICEDAK